MDFPPTSGPAARFLKGLTLALPLALGVTLTACSSSGDPNANSVLMPALATAKSCNNVTGTLDPVQTSLLGQLAPAALSIPALGSTAAGTTVSLSQALDAVDAISRALTVLASTQNPQLFTAELTGVGDSLLCSGSSLSNALAQLAAAQPAALPVITPVQATLALVSQRIADGLVGSAPGADLRVLTDQLVVLADQLRTLTATLPVPANQPYLQQLLTLNANTFSALAVILTDLGALNGTKLSTDVVALLVNTAASLQQAVPAQLGVPAGALTPVVTQFNMAAQTLGLGLGAVAGPTLQAVSAVLGGVNLTGVGTATGAFSDLIDGGLADSAGAASLTRVTQLTGLLTGVGGSTNLVSALLQSFGGILPLGG